LLVMVLAGIASREWYPFSPFPMYSTFTPYSWHVLVTDGDDRTVSTLQLFGISAIPLRRMLERRVMAAQDEAGQSPETAAQRGAVALLRFLLAEARPQPGAPPLPARLRLWRVDARVEGDRVVGTRQLLAEIAPP
jgi:hypothetical protein